MCFVLHYDDRLLPVLHWWLVPGDCGTLHRLIRNALWRIRSVGAYFLLRTLLWLIFSVTSRLSVAAPPCPSKMQIHSYALACNSGYLATFVLLWRAYSCMTLLTKRWMVVGAHGSPKRYLGQASRSRTHQWRIALYQADGTAESCLQQFRRQGHRPAQSAITTSSSASHIFNLALVPNTGNVKDCQVCVECHILPDSYQ